MQVNRREKTLEDDGCKIQEPVAVLNGFPVLLLPQRPRNGFHVARGHGVFESMVDGVEPIPDVPRLGPLRGVKPKPRHLFGHPQTDGMHIFHREPPNQVETRK